MPNLNTVFHCSLETKETIEGEKWAVKYYNNLRGRMACRNTLTCRPFRFSNPNNKNTMKRV
jgi:hypothetical protein